MRANVSRKPNGYLRIRSTLAIFVLLWETKMPSMHILQPLLSCAVSLKGNVLHTRDGLKRRQKARC